jgi:hypothetical protein
MPDGTDTTDTAVAERPTCPMWCDSRPAGHTLDDATSGVLHTHTLDRAPLPELPGRDATRLEVAVSTFESTNTARQPFVELRGLQNSGSFDLSLLTAQEARRLAVWLNEAAKLLQGHRGLLLPAAEAAVEPATAPDIIRHPVWCQQVPDDAPLAGDPPGSGSYYDRLGPAEESDEHVGREYRIDVGATFGYSVVAAQVALHGGGDSHDTIRLSVVDQEQLDASAAAYMSTAEARQVARMLERVSRG